MTRESLLDARDLAEQVLDGTLPYEEAWHELAKAVIALTRPIEDLFRGSIVTEPALRAHIEVVRKQMPKAATEPHLLAITALAFACERLLDAWGTA